MLIYLLTEFGLTPGGGSTVQDRTHLHTNNTQNNTMKQNNQNETYISIKIHKRNKKIHNSKIQNKHTTLTTIYKIIQNGTKRI